MSDGSSHAAPGAAAAAIRIEVCGPAAEKDWNGFVGADSHASFYHRFEWSSINRQELGNEPFFLVARQGGVVAGILPLCLVKSPWFGRIVCSMPYVNYGGPCAASEDVREALVHEAVAVTNRVKAKYLELRTCEPIRTQLPVSLRKVSLTLELDADPEKLWSKFTSKHRTNIRRAQKNDLTVRSGGLELLDTFYATMEDSWRQLGTPLYARSYFERILRTFPEHTRIFVCAQGDEPIAVAFNGYLNGIVEGMWAGGSARSRELQANYVLYWEMIRDACVRGCRSYHLGRSTADSGAEDFKKKWNATSRGDCSLAQVAADGHENDRSAHRKKHSLTLEHGLHRTGRHAHSFYAAPRRPARRP
jgi:FemAB-related protein (PEP-CTERM system-associated)